MMCTLILKQCELQGKETTLPTQPLL